MDEVALEPLPEPWLLASNWGLPICRRGEFSGIGHLDLPAPPSPAMRAVTMRPGALGRLELITRIPGHDSIAAAARALYGGRVGALQQMIAKIETAAGFPVIDKSSTPLSPTDAGRGFIREAHQILHAAREQTTAPPKSIRKVRKPRSHPAMRRTCRLPAGRGVRSGPNAAGFPAPRVLSSPTAPFGLPCERGVCISQMPEPRIGDDPAASRASWLLAVALMLAGCFQVVQLG